MTTMHSGVKSTSLPYQRGVSEAVARVIAARRACANLKVIYLRERFADAQVEAEAKDRAVARGTRSPLAHLTLTVKACFDVAGWVSDAASAAVTGNKPARLDAPIVHFLRSHGATVVEHSNMTEFAGGAVAVASGLADVALGTDTSGSVRIPAAFCGMVGFKPSRGVFSSEGCIPLSTTFGVPGQITRDVGVLLEAAGVFDHLVGIVADSTGAQSRPSLAGIRFVIPDNFALEGTGRSVRDSFNRTVARLTAAGAVIVRTHFSDLRAASRAAVEGGVITAEAYAWHRNWIYERASLYDPLVGPRILQDETKAAHRYTAAFARIEARARLFDAEMEPFDVLLTPTVPILPPRIGALSQHDEYLRLNALTFGITELENRVDLPSLSLPDRRQGRQSVGLMLTGRRGMGRRLLEIAEHVEAALV